MIDVIEYRQTGTSINNFIPKFDTILKLRVLTS